MEKRRLGSTDMEVSILGFGGAEIGFGGASAETVDALLGSALDAGLNLIDTAECYKNSEELIGEAVSHRRDQFYLLTKCGHANGIDLPDWDLRLLEQSIDRSLKNLRTDRVDLIQLHSCPEEMLRQGDVIAVLQRARDAGKTRYIGYSGDHNAALYAVQCGAFDTLQTSVSIADQEPIDLTLPLTREKGMGVIAKRPIANAAWQFQSADDAGYGKPYWERLQKLQYDFLNGSVEEVANMALRFTLSLPGVHTAIAGTMKPGRWSQNARALEGGLLSPAEVEAIRARWKEVAGPDWIGQT